MYLGISFHEAEKIYTIVFCKAHPVIKSNWAEIGFCTFSSWVDSFVDVLCFHFSKRD